MTLEELQNGLGVPVSMEAYAELDAKYLSGNYRDCHEFIRELCAQFPDIDDREFYVNNMHYLHLQNTYPNWI